MKEFREKFGYHDSENLSTFWLSKLDTSRTELAEEVRKMKKEDNETCFCDFSNECSCVKDYNKALDQVLQLIEKR